MRNISRVGLGILCAGMLSLTACDNKAWERQNTVTNADQNGADWIVTQDTSDMKVGRCWTLHNVSVANEEHSDGIHWLNNAGELLHISGWYNRVMVVNGDWKRAAQQVDVTDLTKCHNG